VGYSDGSNFRRDFVAVRGVTPAEWQRAAIHKKTAKR
jgi:AraC-like DNA-binding protein